jgi:hypothetical protein
VDIVVKGLLSGNMSSRTEAFDLEAFSKIIKEPVLIKEIMAALVDSSSARLNGAFVGKTEGFKADLKGLKPQRTGRQETWDDVNRKV